MNEFFYLVKIEMIFNHKSFDLKKLREIFNRKESTISYCVNIEKVWKETDCFK
jgi:hypothetical protein